MICFLIQTRLIDMFSQTSRFETIHLFVSNHVETIVLIERVRNAKDFVQIGIDMIHDLHCLYTMKLER